MTTRSFITGETGFAGYHLLTHLIQCGHRVWGYSRGDSGVSLSDHSQKYTHINGDLLDGDHLTAVLKEVRPHHIYHLAGQAYPGRSWQIPAETIAVNTSGTANVLSAAIELDNPRVVVVTSGDVYSDVTADQLPLTEMTHAIPRHPYGISKLAAGQLVRVFAERFGLNVVEARPFNHSGPNQSLGFVLPDFASQVADIILGNKPAVMKAGNLSAERDFTDVRDVVRAYRLLAEGGRAGETYLISSGQARPIQSILDTLLALSDTEIKIEIDPERLRPADIPVLYGSYDKIEAAVGWRPEIAFETTVQDVLNDWLEKGRK